MASRKNELVCGFFVCLHSVSFTCGLGITTMVEITDCRSLICFIIISLFALEYQVCFAVFALLEAPCSLVLVIDFAVRTK